MKLTLDEQCDRGLKPNQTEICRNPECHFTPIVQILSPNIAGKKGQERSKISFLRILKNLRVI